MSPPMYSLGHLYNFCTLSETLQSDDAADNLRENVTINKCCGMDLTTQPINPHEQHSFSLLSPKALIYDSVHSCSFSKPTTVHDNLDYTCVPNSQHVSCGSITHTHISPDLLDKSTHQCSLALEKSCNCSSENLIPLVNTSNQEISQPELDFTCELDSDDISKCIYEQKSPELETVAFQTEVSRESSQLPISFGLKTKKCYNRLHNDSSNNILVDNSLQSSDVISQVTSVESYQQSLPALVVEFTQASKSSLRTTQKCSVSLTPQSKPLLESIQASQNLTEVDLTQQSVPNVFKPKDSSMSQVLNKLRQSFDSVDITTIATPEAVSLSSCHRANSSLLNLDSTSLTYDVKERSFVPSPLAFTKFEKMFNCDQTINDTCISSPLQNSRVQMESHQRPIVLSSHLMQIKTR